MAFEIKNYRIDRKNSFKIDDFSTNGKKDIAENKDERNAILRELAPELDHLQDLLYAEHQRKVLIVLQGMDTSGKDGTIRAVFQSVDPLAVRTAYFKAPTENELDRDYLWRVHNVVPRRGEIVIFNRSHYEDVLVTKVKGWIDDDEEQRRLRQINEFERLLSETGTVIVKFFLHISKDEQKERLQERLDNPDKNWKFNLGDLDDRKLWGDFQKQYEKVINATSTEYAPWYVIPADSKSGRNVIIMQILLDTLRVMQMQYPKVDTSNWPKTID
ncbi:polyphosphate kinase 2 family protein [Testudinibacter sp. TR-2022]|uniref:PPK2 family polyphosphate kinase n=1 Tax=Testudinibacter sp. TR-2022 TaxID=2585029 RepID=UPI00111A6C14|nr:PPK2 family polyphosphate kinase [Testudinibacter sp. TR-2022]TNH05383.1 polyphosphate kinase 2 family protein [Pasteurellaceae bacterium Phil31]TNH09926.1 polyphosphate kinase 2 family protein [Testudinibacter sp. TR-2022]TNH12186.1 polyphosphate kinase 2 family protein [Testudinibacter sp. TR-2022]TNH14816.1 polyphosphate kinase 2 family protein [Testudinibacter sp. TR-2022]TNH15452.1 polyphosphate kinase 2 family protein [Testudinibacter sp. TR-2022]